MLLQKTASAGDKLDKVSRKSFAKGANEQTFQFPCMISDSCPVPFASTVTRNLDRLYASFVQIYLSANGIIDLNYIKNPRQFINQYQSHFKLESVEFDEICEYEEAYRDFFEAGGSLYLNDENEIALAFTESQTYTNTMKEKLELGLKTVHDIYNTKPIGGVVLEADDNLKGDILDAYLNSKSTAIDKDNVQATEKARSPLMGDKEIKKMNDMQPYLLDLKLLATKGESGLAQYVTYNVGVKTTLHLGKSDVLVKNLVYVLKNKHPMFNFIRWTTGELSLLKDIILNIEDINFNVANKYDKTGKFLSCLKRMKNKPVKINSSGLSKTTPFATIVISSYEYNTILNQYGFDLKNMAFANKIMEELYLMCFMIIDEGTQTVDMLLDGATSGYQTYSLDILEKETTLRSNKLGEELTRMLGN